MAELVMIPVTEKTKNRVFQHRTKPGITYDMLVNAAFDALEGCNYTSLKSLEDINNYLDDLRSEILFVVSSREDAKLIKKELAEHRSQAPTNETGMIPHCENEVIL